MKSLKCASWDRISWARSAPVHFALDEQVLARRERADTLVKTAQKVRRLRCCGLARDGLNEGQDVLGAVIDLAHEEADLLLLTFALGAVRYERNHFCWLPAVSRTSDSCLCTREARPSFAM